MMNRTKKWLALALALVLVLSLAACGKKAASAYVPGTVTGDVYTNASAGFACKAAEGWSFATEEDLASLNELTEEQVDNAELSKLLEDSGEVIEMSMSDTTGASVNVAVENLGVLYGSVLDESGYIEAAMDNLTEAYSSIGFEDPAYETVDVEFAGQTHKAVTVEASYSGYTLYQELVCVKCDANMVVVTFTAFGEDTIASMMDMFYATT